MKTLLDVCELIVDCPHSTAKDEGAGYPLIRTPNIGKGRFILDGVHLVSEDVYNKRNHRAVPMDDDIILAREAPAGNVAIIKNGAKYCLGQRTVLIRPNKKSVNPDFLTYYLLAPEQQHKLLSSATGATVAHVNMPVIRGLEVSLPPLETQNRIASILSAYDDLIENNQKQIKLLEEAAQRLYKEWFVDLHFPGHEDVKIVDGVPEGWKKGHINELIAYDIGGGWGEESSSSECQVPAFVIRGTDFDSLAKGDMENIPFRYHKESNYCKRKLEEGDIVFEVSGGSKNEGVARTMFVTKSLLNGLKNSVICASFCKLVRPKKGFSKYLYDSFRYMRSCHITEQYDKRSASSIVNFRWQEFLVQEMVLIPSHNVLNQYNDLSLNINKIIERKVKTCNLAKEARDRLLPKLMSGEIEV